MKRIVALALVFALIAPAARAQTQGQTQAADQGELFRPTSGWLVGPATAAETDNSGTTPCLMLNQYENGFAFRFSGGDGKIFAVAIDFRQPAFRPSQHYPLSIAIDEHFDRKFDAVAYDSSVLIVSAPDPKTADSFYKALAGGQDLAISLGHQRIDFALLGTTNGLQRLESCFGVSPTPSKEQLSGSGPAIPTIVVHPTSPPPPLRGVDAALNAAEADVQAASGSPAGDISRADPSAPQQPATAGTDQESGGPTPEPAGAPSPIPTAETSATPPGTPAVESAEARDNDVRENTARETNGNPAAAQPVYGADHAAAISSPPPDEGGPVPAPVGAGSIHAPPNDHPAMPPEESASSGRSMSWRVRSHASLRSTLLAWSEQGGADLIWQMKSDVPVPESLSMDGSYEQAVQGLLTEYENAAPRPAGSLIVDPSSGRKQLTIRSVEGSPSP